MRVKSRCRSGRDGSYPPGFVPRDGQETRLTLLTVHQPVQPELPLPRLRVRPSTRVEDLSKGETMRCYFNLVSSDQTITDEEGLEVTDMEEARTFAREAVTEMVQDGVAE